MAMKKKIDKEKAFNEYRKNYLKKFFDQNFKLLLKKHKKEIENFRKEWILSKWEIKTQEDYDGWLKSIEKPLSAKKRDVTYLEEEEGHILRGYETVAIEYLALSEESPRVFLQGNSLEVVFDYELRVFMRKLQIDTDWYPLFRHYILTKNIELTAIVHPNIEVTERFLYGPDSDELDHRISLNFGPNTRINEVKAVWRYIIEPLQKSMKALWKGKTRERPTAEIGLQAYKLRRKGLTYKEILSKLDPYSVRFDEFSIRKAAERAKKRLAK